MCCVLEFRHRASDLIGKREKERNLVLSLRFGFGVFLLFGFLFLCFFFGSRLERFFDLRWILVREGFELIWVRRLK